MRTVSLRGLTFFGLLALSCGGGVGGGSCGGSGCGSCGDGTYEYPAGDPNRPDAVLQEAAGRARITQSFIDFIRPQLPDVLREMFGGAGSGMYVDANDVLHIPIPDVDIYDIGISEAKVRDGEALLWLDDLDQKLDLRFEQPNGVRLSMANLRLGIQLDLREEFVGSDASCPVVGDLGPGPVKHAAEISLNVLIEPGVDNDANFDIDVTIDDITLDDLDIALSGNYCNTEPQCQDCLLEVGGTCLDPGGRCNECYLMCDLITDSLLSLVTAVLDLVNPLLNRILKPVIDNFVQDALAGLNGTPAKVETQVSLYDISGLEMLRLADPFGLFVGPEPGKFPIVDRGTGDGMEITIDGGAEAELADCIASLPPFDMPKGPVPVLGGTDSGGNEYHVGVTVASTLINQMLYAIHRSGSLCLRIGSRDVQELTGGSFVLNASILSLLASDLAKVAEDRAPVIIQLKPRSAAVVDLGSGELIGQDAMGNDVYDWLLQLSLDDIGIAFHVFIQDRYVRIFEVTTDVNLGANIVVLPSNALQIAIGELRIDDFEEEFNELLPNADFAMILPTLIELVMSALLTQELTFDVDISESIADALGAPIFLHVNEIIRDGIQEDYLTLLMTFSSTTATTALSLGAETFAELHEDDALHSPSDSPDGAMRPTGRVRLRVGMPLAHSDQMELEYQIRVDNGLWRAFRPARPDATIYVEDAHLLVPGPHLVDVRARYQGDYMSLDPSPARVKALIDPVAPSISGWVADDTVQIRVDDNLSGWNELLLKGRLDDGPWFEIPLEELDGEASATISLSVVGSHKRLELIAQDRTGNRSSIATVRIGLHPEGLTGGSDSDEDAGCGCALQKREPNPPMTGALIALLAGLLGARRKRF